jgi:hypothetical protein
MSDTQSELDEGEWMQENGMTSCEVCERDAHESEVKIFKDGIFRYSICKDCLSTCPICKGTGKHEGKDCECWKILMEVEND